MFLLKISEYEDLLKKKETLKEDLNLKVFAQIKVN